MSTGRERAAARDLQRQALAHPRTEAFEPDGTVELRHFAKIDRELMWGLTLNK